MRKGIDVIVKNFILYKIFYDDTLVYIGRTKQDLKQRLRGHFFSKPMHRKIDIFRVTRIEIAQFEREADMYVYEVYLINLHKPPLNVDDRARDELTLLLPKVRWSEFECNLMDKWKNLLSKEENKQMYQRNYGAITRLEET